MNNALTESEAFAKQIRILTLKMVTRAKASHIGSAFSIADLIAVLYVHILRFNPSDPRSIDRDRLILSKGHACSIVYAALNQLGWVSEEELDTYGNDLSDFMTHISHHVTGVEFSTGSLGHGLPFGVGKALAAKIQKTRWRSFVILSDGEMDEGSNWEALMFAAHHKLDNLVAVIDYNKLQSLDSVSNTLELEPLREKLLAFGWSVREVDGHDHNAIIENLGRLPWDSRKPSVLIAHTVKGKGVSFMENSIKWHYKSPTQDEYNRALLELNNA